MLTLSMRESDIGYDEFPTFKTLFLILQTTHAYLKQFLYKTIPYVRFSTPYYVVIYIRNKVIQKHGERSTLALREPGLRLRVFGRVLIEYAALPIRSIVYVQEN